MRDEHAHEPFHATDDALTTTMHNAQWTLTYLAYTSPSRPIPSHHPTTNHLYRYHRRCFTLSSFLTVTLIIPYIIPLYIEFSTSTSGIRPRPRLGIMVNKSQDRLLYMGAQAEYVLSRSSLPLRIPDRYTRDRQFICAGFTCVHRCDSDVSASRLTVDKIWTTGTLIAEESSGLAPLSLSTSPPQPATALRLPESRCCAEKASYGTPLQGAGEKPNRSSAQLPIAIRLRLPRDLEPPWSIFACEG